MGLFGGTKTPKTPTRTTPGRVLKASGMRIERSNQEAIRALAASRQSWQSDAWDYRDMIGELRFAVQFLARAVSRVKFMPAQVMRDEDEPIPLDSDQGVEVSVQLRNAAQEELDRLPLDSGYSFIGVIAENMEITGECWLHGFNRYNEEIWEGLSVDEVEAGVDGRMSIRRYGTLAAEPVEDDEEMLRLWVPHPRRKMLADSPMRALLSACEDLILAGREMRAASRSRFAANGVLLVPDSLAMLNALKEDNSLVRDSEFLADLTAVLLAPINNEGDPGAVVPAVITGDAEDLQHVRHLRMEREDSQHLLDKMDKALARIARGLDIPPEIVTGMADANHWTAWQIDASTYRHHIDPLVRIVADSLTEAFLRPALRARGFSAEEVKQVQIWYDAGAITENPNRGQDALNAFDRGGIGYDALNKALGFNESDLPSDEEVLRMIAFKIGVDPATSAVMLQALLSDGKGIIPPPAPVTVPSRRGDQEPALPPAQQPGTPDEATPNTQPQMSQGAARLLEFLVAASPPDEEPADPTWIVDTSSGRKLMELDRAERERILRAADDALTRALEKAGAKLRSKAQKNAAHRAALAGVDVFAIGKTLGREAVLALGVNEQELLGGALDALEQKFTNWIMAAIDRAIDVVLSLLRLDRESERGQQIAARLHTAMSERVGSGWAMFRDALMRLAERYLYDPTPEQWEGEDVPDVIVPPALARGVLAHIGGAHPDTGGVDDEGGPARAGRPLGGIALGEEVAAVLADEGARELGFEWAYGITAVRHFEPHRKLDGERFSSWADPRLATDARYAWVGDIFTPGDHKGCMCDYVPAYAIAEREQSTIEELGPESASARDDRLLAESDDAAGRTGTTAQAARDERNRIQELQRRWMSRE